MPTPTRTIETDVCVVGAGLIGLAHALEARHRKLSVVVLEQGAQALGASVRGTGHLFFSGVADAALTMAPPARERWLELARQAGLGTIESGTLIIARRAEEMGVMETAAAQAARRARMRSAKKIGKLAPIPTDGVLGGFHAKQDLRVDPRAAPAALGRLLVRDPSARVEWGTHVHEIEPGVVHAGALRVRAGAIIVCPGADRHALPAGLTPREPRPALSKAQMLRLAAPAGRRYRQTLMSGSSLLSHAGFRMQEGSQQLRERLELETPELVERGVAPVVAQVREGDLILGGTSTYTESAKPFSRERLDELLLEQARLLLGFQPAVRQRWLSSELSLEGGHGDLLVTRPLPGVRLVRAVGSTAAALCHAHAAAVLDELLAGPSAVDMYITVRDMRRSGEGAGGMRDHARAFGTRQP